MCDLRLLTDFTQKSKVTNRTAAKTVVVAVFKNPTIIAYDSAAHCKRKAWSDVICDVICVNAGEMQLILDQLYLQVRVSING